jgi:preprotein translocase subunit YajC
MSESTAQANGIASLLPIAALMLLFYFLTMRPQQKRYKEQRAMLNNLQTGDEIVTVSGIYGTVTQVNPNNILELNIASGVSIKLKKDAVATVLPRGSL